ncbi:MAG: hypothetical protein E7650_02670 [Ruminococcaceae bacterium]|nr:hypothetical protein [Oscillospiraceae bacterium]
MKRILCLIMACCLLVPLLVACRREAELTIIEDGACVIVYDVDTVDKALAEAVANDIEKAFDAEVTLQASSSFLLDVTADKNTILLGFVDFEPCREVLLPLRNKDFVVGVYGDYYIVGGKNTETTSRAVRYFREEVLGAAEGGDQLKVSAADNHLYQAKYSVESMTVGGVPLYECEIVLPKNEQVFEYRLAMKIQNILLLKTGYDVPVIGADKASAKGQIRIGQAVCTGLTVSATHGYAMRVTGTALEIAATSLYGYEEAYEAFLSRVINVGKEQHALSDKLSVSGSGAYLVTAAQACDADVRVLFNNIWNGSDDAETAQRAQMQVALYLQYAPDVLGLQECSPTMRNRGIDGLLDAGYREVPSARATAYYRNETVTRTPLFYNTNTVELLEYGHLSLHTLDFSDSRYAHLLYGGITSADMRALMDQDKYGPDEDGSKGVTWAIFRVKKTGHVFMVGSTHLWWQGRDNRDDAARVIQMEIMKSTMLAKSRSFATSNGLDGTVPLFIGGDYNTRITRYSYTSMSTNTAYDDLNSLLPADQRMQDATVHAYPTFDEELGIWNGKGAPRGDYPQSLDYVFAPRAVRSAYEVVRAQMLYEDYAFLTSDHSPIFVDLNFTATTPVMSGS